MVKKEEKVTWVNADHYEKSGDLYYITPDCRHIKLGFIGSDVTSNTLSGKDKESRYNGR